MIASRDAHFLEDVERDKRSRGEATIKKSGSLHTVRDFN